MRRKTKSVLSYMSALILVLITTFTATGPDNVQAASINFVILSDYSETLSVGEEFYLIAITSTGKYPTFKSSNSKVASVNSYGKITAKKSGTATITAKISKGEASCKIKVAKTDISISKKSLTLNCGYSGRITATSSTGHTITFKSSKTSIATVDGNGNIYAKKPGSTTITASCDGSKVTCRVTVKKPTLTLSAGSVKMYRNQTYKLTASSSSRGAISYRSSKKSVATVDSSGKIKAIKHGTARITVTVDGVSKVCEITVASPTIQCNVSKITLDAGQTYIPTVSVSSGNRVTYSSSNINVATVNNKGLITARQKGKAYIYLTEDGAKVSIIVTVR